MKFHVIVNPAGAGGKTGRYWESIRGKFSGVDTEVHFLRPEERIKEIVSGLTAAGEDINLVIVGGDGSMNEAVNGIRDFSHVKLGLIPSGSANDLAKDIGVAPDIEEQVQRICRGETVRAIDVGELILHNRSEPDNPEVTTACEEHIRFNVSAGIGWDAEICYFADHSRLKKPLNKIRLGKLIYISEAVRTVFAMRPFVCTVEDGNTEMVYSRCVFSAFMNHRFEGGGFMFGPNARNNDGILDACTVDKVTPVTFFMLFPKAYKGKQFESSYAFEQRAASFRVRTDRPLFVHTDGEVACLSSDITVRILKEKLNLLF